MSEQIRQKLVVVVNEEGHSVTYVVRESDEAIAIEASVDPRTSAATAVRELVSLVCAVLPTGLEKFYAFKIMRMVEENIDDLRDRMESQATTNVDDFPF